MRSGGKAPPCQGGGGGARVRLAPEPRQGAGGGSRAGWRRKRRSAAGRVCSQGGARSTLLAARSAVQLCWQSKQCLALTPTCVLRFLQAAQFQAGRCLYAGHAYLAAHKPREANAVFGRARERAAGAVERWRECEHPDAEALADLEAMPEQVEVSIQVELLGKGQRWVLYAISVPQAMHGVNRGVAGDAPAYHTPGCVLHTKADPIHVPPVGRRAYKCFQAMNTIIKCESPQFPPTDRGDSHFIIVFMG